MTKSKKKSTKPGVAKTKAPKAGEFYSDAGRGSRVGPRKQFHVLLTLEEHAALVKLSHKMKLNAAGVFRALIAKASS